MLNSPTPDPVLISSFIDWSAFPAAWFAQATVCYRGEDFTFRANYGSQSEAYSGLSYVVAEAMKWVKRNKFDPEPEYEAEAKRKMEMHPSQIPFPAR